MILRLSHKLAKKIRVGKLDELPLNENPYADWSGHLFLVDRVQYIILSNTKSLYSCVLFGKGITDDGTFIARSLSILREFMEDDGQQFAYHKFIAPTTGTVSFAKALNRSVTGSMNELVLAAKRVLASGNVSPHDVGFELNSLLLSALSSDKSRGYGKPKQAFKRLEIADS